MNIPLLSRIFNPEKQHVIAQSHDDGHDSRAIANIFVEKFQQDNKQLTITQIVKLVYLAHGWTLGYTGEPLIADKVEAWRTGPSVPQAYKAFRPQGIIIREQAKKRNGEPFSIAIDLTDSETKIIDGVYKDYSILSVTSISCSTHERGAPWHEFYNSMSYRTIPNDAIRIYYEKCAKQQKEKYIS